MHSRTPQQVLDDEFPVMRAKVLELAAALDRVDRAEGPPADGDHLATIRSAIETLLRPNGNGANGNRAEQVQLLLSRAYAEDWREKMKV